MAEFVRIARETVEGLAAAHALDVVYRDLRFSNILVENKFIQVYRIKLKASQDNLTAGKPVKLYILFGLTQKTMFIADHV